MFLTSLKFLSIEQKYFGRSTAAGEESDKRFQQNIEYFKELTFLLSEWKTKYQNIFVSVAASLYNVCFFFNFKFFDYHNTIFYFVLKPLLYCESFGWVCLLALIFKLCLGAIAIFLYVTTAP